MLIYAASFAWSLCGSFLVRASLACCLGVAETSANLKASKSTPVTRAQPTVAAGQSCSGLVRNLYASIRSALVVVGPSPCKVTKLIIRFNSKAQKHVITA